MRPFDQFDCILKWRMYDDDSALDYDVYFNSTLSMYQVREEFDLKFIYARLTQVYLINALFLNNYMNLFLF